MEGEEVLGRVMTFFAVSFILSALITQTAGQWIAWMIITAIIMGIMVMNSGVYSTKDPNNKNRSDPSLAQRSLSKKQTKKKRKCSLCKKEGHTKRTCPNSKKNKAQKRKDEEQIVRAWNDLMARQRSKSSGHRITFQIGEKIRVCLGTLDNPCRKMRPGNAWRCPDECGGASFVDRTYEGEEWAKESGYR